MVARGGRDGVLWPWWAASWSSSVVGEVGVGKAGRQSMGAAGRACPCASAHATPHVVGSLVVVIQCRGHRCGCSGSASWHSRHVMVHIVAVVVATVGDLVSWHGRRVGAVVVAAVGDPASWHGRRIGAFVVAAVGQRPGIVGASCPRRSRRCDRSG
jgi:hypothetical protein